MIKQIFIFILAVTLVGCSTFKSNNTQENIQATNITDLGPAQQQEVVQIKQELKEEVKKKNNKTPEEIEQNKKDVKKLQRRIRTLKKQAGAPKGPNMKNVSITKPRPANNNPQGVRCFMRYNNQGNPYRICSSGGDTSKPPAQLTQPIPVKEFLDKLGKSYAELTEGQRREYHRIDMANRRFDDRMNNAPVKDALDEVLREQRRLGGFAIQQARIDEALEKKQLQEELMKAKVRYKKLIKESNMTKEQIKGKAKQDLLDKAGLSDKKLKKYKKAGVKLGNLEKPKKEVQQEIKDLKEQAEKVKSNIKTTKETIKDGKKVVQQTLEVKTKKNTKLTFD